MLASKRIERLVVDANPLIAVLLGGAAVRVFLGYPDRVGEFAVCEYTLEEVRRFIPKLAQDLGADPGHLRLVLSLLPLERYSREIYEDLLEEAERRIGLRDPNDVDVLALALKLNCPLWSNDKDFDDVGVERLTTAQLLRWLGI